VQTFTLVAPETVEEVPAAQGVHELDALASEYVPAEQVVHDDAFVPEYEPGAHEAHTVAWVTVENVPGRHDVQVRSLSCLVPGWQISLKL